MIRLLSVLSLGTLDKLCSRNVLFRGIISFFLEFFRFLEKRHVYMIIMYLADDFVQTA